MKKIFYSILLLFTISIVLQGCSSKNEILDNSKSSESIETNILENKITKEMAYEGVNNYCHSEFDWSITEDNPEIMYVTMDDELETEYKLVFRSYTGTFMYFYVDKLNGNTRMVEYVPTLNIEKEVGTISLYEYLNKKEEEDKQDKSNLSLKDFVGAYSGMNENTENSSMSIVQSGDSYIITNTRESVGSRILKDSNMRYYLDHGQSDDWDCLEYIDAEGCEYQFRKRNRDGLLIVSICQNEFVELYTNE